MNLILENTDQVKFFTNLKEVFLGLRVNCADYDWFISDVETNGFNVREGWHSGTELDSLINENDIQFIWAVLSSFKRGTRFDVIKSPYVYDNPSYWDASEPKTQLAGAEFEIGCWDSSATILVGLNEQLASNFKEAYSDVMSLSDAAR